MRLAEGRQLGRRQAGSRQETDNWGEDKEVVEASVKHAGGRKETGRQEAVEASMK
jgi:hypothetical protein